MLARRVGADGGDDALVVSRDGERGALVTEDVVDLDITHAVEAATELRLPERLGLPGVALAAPESNGGAHRADGQDAGRSAGRRIDHRLVEDVARLVLEHIDAPLTPASREDLEAGRARLGDHATVPHGELRIGEQEPVRKIVGDLR